MFSLSHHWIAICVVPAAITGELGSDNRLPQIRCEERVLQQQTHFLSGFNCTLCFSDRTREGGERKIYLLLSVSPASPQIRVLVVNMLHGSFLKEGIKANLKQSMP